MAPHSSTLARKIPWTEEPGGLQSMGSLRVRHDWATSLSLLTFTSHFHALEKEMATHSSVLAWRIPGMGEHGGLPSMGSHRVGHDWSDLAAAVDICKCYSINSSQPLLPLLCPQVWNISKEETGKLCLPSPYLARDPAYFPGEKIIFWGPAWGTPPMAKVMRKKAWHTQRRDQASGNPLFPSIYPPNQSLFYALKYTSDFTGGSLPSPFLSEKELMCSSK